MPPLTWSLITSLWWPLACPVFMCSESGGCDGDDPLVCVTIAALKPILELYPTFNQIDRKTDYYRRWLGYGHFRPEFFKHRPCSTHLRITEMLLKMPVLQPFLWWTESDSALWAQGLRVYILGKPSSQHTLPDTDTWELGVKWCSFFFILKMYDHGHNRTS